IRIVWLGFSGERLRDYLQVESAGSAKLLLVREWRCAYWAIHGCLPFPGNTKSWSILLFTRSFCGSQVMNGKHCTAKIASRNRFQGLPAGGQTRLRPLPHPRIRRRAENYEDSIRCRQDRAPPRREEKTDGRRVVGSSSATIRCFPASQGFSGTRADHNNARDRIKEHHARVGGRHNGAGFARQP